MSVFTIALMMYTNIYIYRYYVYKYVFKNKKGNMIKDTKYVEHVPISSKTACENQF